MSFTSLVLIINGLFVFILLIGFLIGLWRGLKKSAVSCVFSVVAMLLAFFITPFISKSILAIQISTGTGSMSIQNYILDMLTKDASIANLLKTTPSLQAFIIGVPNALINIVVFMLMNVVLHFVMYIIYKIFVVAFFKTKKKDESVEEEPKKHRLLGGVVGLIKALVITVFVFLPITSLFGLANELISDDDSMNTIYGAAQTVMADSEKGDNSGNIISKNLPKIAVDAIRAFDRSAFSYLGGIGEMDDALFDYYTQIDVEGDKIAIRSEISNYWKVYQVANQLSQLGSENKSFAKINFDKLDRVVDDILDSGMFKSIISEIAGTFIRQYDELEITKNIKLGEAEEVIKALRNSITDNTNMAEYLSHDIKIIYNAFKELCKSGILDEINKGKAEVTDILKVITSEDNFEVTKGQIVSIFDMNILRAASKPVVNILIKQVMKNAESCAAETSTWSNKQWESVAENLATVLQTAQKVLDEVDFDKILDTPLSLLENNEQGKPKYNLNSIFTNVGTLIDLVRENKLFVTSEGKSIVDKLLQDNKFVLPTENVIDIKGESIKVDTYSKLFTQILLPSLNKLQASNVYKEFDKDEIDAIAVFELLATNCAKDDKFLSDIFLPLYQVEPTKTYLFGEHGNINKMGGQIDFSKLTSYDMWKNDLKQITDLIVNLQAIKIGEGANQKTGIEYLLGSSSDMSNFMVGIGLADIDDAEGGKGYRTNGALTSVVKPMLYAKSTSSLATEIFDLLRTSINSMLGTGYEATLTLPENACKVEGDDQAQEICDILENFLSIYSTYDTAKQAGSSISFKDIDKSQLGMLLNAMKANRYRNDGDNSKTNGVFSDVFDKLMSYVEHQYPFASYGIKFSDDEGSYKTIDFVTKMQQLQTVIDNMP